MVVLKALSSPDGFASTSLMTTMPCAAPNQMIIEAQSNARIILLRNLIKSPRSTAWDLQSHIIVE
jgi:hypothetical protein